MFGAIKGAIASVVTSIKASLTPIVAVSTATVLTGSFIYYYTIKDGIYEKSADNVRYALEECINQVAIDSIVENGHGGYAYTTDLDNMTKEVVKKLKQAGREITSYTGKGKEEKVLRSLIQAELITNYPDLRSKQEIEAGTEFRENELQGGIKIVKSNSSVDTTAVNNEDLSEYDMTNSQILTYIPYEQFNGLRTSGDSSINQYFSLKPSSVSSSLSGNFVVKTDELNSAPVLTKEQIENAIKATYAGDAQSNLLGAVDAFVKIQDENKVNAVFAIAVTQKESSCGTNWDAIDSSSYNWMSVKSSSSETGWAQYSSFSDATEQFGNLISGDIYFGSNRVSVSDIAPKYCNENWGYRVNEYMAQIYNSIGIDIEQTNNVTNTTQTNTNNSVDIVVAGWTQENTTVKTVEYMPNNSGTEEVLNEKTEDQGTTYRYREVSINYQSMLTKYSMPAGFLWSLLVMGENVNFVLKLADLAIEDTEIVIEAQDNVVKTINQNVQKFKYKKDVTKTVVYGSENETKTKNNIATANTESTITTILTTKQSNTKLNLTYARTWLATYKKNYKNTVNGEIQPDDTWQEEAEWEDLEDISVGTTVSESEDPNNDIEYEDMRQVIRDGINEEKCRIELNQRISTTTNQFYSLFQRDTDNKLKEECTEYIFNYIKGYNIQDVETEIFMIVNELHMQQPLEENIRVDVLYTDLKEIGNNIIRIISAQTSVSLYKIENKTASNMQTGTTNTYTSSGTITKERTEIDEEDNFVTYFNESGRAKEYIMQSPDWLFEMLESHPKTANMIDILKYLLYQSTDVDFGVTEFDFDVIDSSGYNNMGTIILGNTVEEKVWFSLKNAGYSDEQVAGIMGNIWGESGFRPDAIEGGSGEGHGLCQWSFGRKENLKLFAESRGKDWSDVDIQIEFLLGELNSSGGADGYARYQLMNKNYGGVLYPADSLENAKTVEEATKAFCFCWERPNEQVIFDRTKYSNIYARIEAGEGYYDQYHGMILSGGNYQDGADESNGIIGRFTSGITGRTFTIYDQNSPAIGLENLCNQATAASIASGYRGTKTEMDVVEHSKEVSIPSDVFLLSTPKGTNEFFETYGLNAEINAYSYSVNNIRSYLMNGGYIAIWFDGEAVGKNGSRYSISKSCHWVAILGYRNENGKEEIFISDPGWGSSGWKDIDEFEDCKETIGFFTTVHP